MKRSRKATRQQLSRAGARGGGSGLVRAKAWHRIVRRFGGACAYCSRSVENPTIDHVRPITRGGAHVAWNVVPACGSCNRAKGDKLLGSEWAPPKPHPALATHLEIHG